MLRRRNTMFETGSQAYLGLTVARYIRVVIRQPRNYGREITGSSYSALHGRLVGTLYDGDTRGFYS